MWALYEKGELLAESKLTGIHLREDAPADSRSVLRAIDDARAEAMRRELGRQDQVE